MSYVSPLPSFPSAALRVGGVPPITTWPTKKGWLDHFIHYLEAEGGYDLREPDLGLSDMVVSNFLLSYEERININRKGPGIVSARTIGTKFNQCVGDRGQFAQEAANALITKLTDQKVQARDTGNPNRRSF